MDEIGYCKDCKWWEGDFIDEPYGYCHLNPPTPCLESPINGKIENSFFYAYPYVYDEDYCSHFKKKGD